MTMVPPREPARLLLVEDNPGDVRLIQEAIEEGRIDYELFVVRDGETALDYLHQRGDHEDALRPHLVLLDLNLPKVNGFAVLERIQENPDLAGLPVIVLTSSTAQEDIVRSYDLHTNAYLMKPIAPDEFIALVQTLETFWLTLVRQPSMEA